MRDHVGADNIFIFGLRAEEVEERRRAGLQASSVIAASPKLAEAIEAIETGLFSPDDADPIRDAYECAATFRLLHGHGRFSMPIS